MGLIANGLNPFLSEKATIPAERIMLEFIHEYVRKGESSSLETTLSGKGYFRLIPEWQSMGYEVKLFFLRLPNTEGEMRGLIGRVLSTAYNSASV